MRRGLVIVLAAMLLLIFAVTASAQSDNLIYNGDFEQMPTLSNGLPKGWSFLEWEQGASSAELFSDSAYGNGIHISNALANDARITQTVQVKPNTCYQLSCDIKADGITGQAGAGISVENTFATSQYIYQQDEWTHVVLTGCTAENQHEVTVALRIGGYGALASGEAWFDNMTMIEQEKILPGAVSFADLDDSYYHQQGSITETDTASKTPTGFWWILIVTIAFAVLFVYFYRKKTFLGAPVQSLDGKKEPGVRSEIVTILVAALVIRAILSLIFVGHSTDISCFRAWSNAMVEGGPANFYTSGMFADYPPGYMYILWFLGAIRSLFGLSSAGPVFIFMLKLPATVADLVSAYIIYRMARRFDLSNSKALALMALMAFNPAAMFISGAWGQVDSLLTLCIFAAIWSFMKQRRILAGVFYGIAVLLKPQALMFGPLFAVVLIMDIFGRGWKRRLLEVLASLVAMFAVIFVLALPFKGSQPWDWLLGKYFSTATSYPYASVEAFNLPALFGGNWTNVNKVPFLLSYGTWGTIFIVLSVVAAIGFYIKERKKNPGALLLASAFLIIAVFTLGQYMHERYLFPALFLLLAAAFYYRDKRLYVCFGWFSLTLLFNTLCAFIIVDDQSARGLMYDLMTRFCSLAQVIGFVYLVKVCFDLMTGRKRKEILAEQETTEEKRQKLEIISLSGQRKRFTRKDHLFCWILTGIYAVLALVNLGTLTVPETYWEPPKTGESVTIEFVQPTKVCEYWVYGNIGNGTAILRTDDGHREYYQQTYDEMFRWQRIETDFEAKSVTLVRYSGVLRINEIAFFDADGNLVDILDITSSQTLAPPEDETSAYHLIDEQSKVPEAPSYLNGMYFDELYHARTAYEHLKGWNPYENSHPPLGKILIMLGIAVFGMNPFGWRIVGTLLGIGMVPLMYLFARQIFKKSEYALLAVLLFAFDFMHFTQTRIATIDVYAVFFIILMYYWMYRYYTMNFHVDGFKATLKPLALSAVFFALGAASKWICIYAGVGLAVLLFASLVRRYREYSYARKSGDEQAIRQTQRFWRNTVYTLLWCCLLFIIMPIIVYVLSYLPYMLCENKYGLEKVWEYQEFMLNYHGQLTATHPYQSSWWEWPFTFRPMWYYDGRGNIPAGYVSTLTASGNPAVWWVGTIGTLLLIVQRIRGKIKPDRALAVILVGCAANYLPWILISRCTFIYHFFATVPFIVLCSVYLLEKMEEKYPYLAWVKYVWMILCLLLFALLYPGISGAVIPRSYAAFLKYLPGGVLIKGV